MRKFMSVLTMILVLLASGAAQMAYHICDEDGAHIWSDTCHTESFASTSNHGSCCKEKSNIGFSETACCKEAYFFALSPLPVTPTKFQLTKTTQWFSAAWSRIVTVSFPYCGDSNHWAKLGKHPPDVIAKNPTSDVICVWII